MRNGPDLLGSKHFEVFSINVVYSGDSFSYVFPACYLSRNQWKGTHGVLIALTNKYLSCLIVEEEAYAQVSSNDPISPYKY